MIPVLAQTSFPAPSVPFTWQAILFIVGGLSIVALVRTAFPKKQPPPEVDAALVEQRLTALEEKDRRDVQSRAAMHEEIETLTLSVKGIESKMETAMASHDDLRAETNRAITAGAERVESLRNFITSELTKFAEKIGEVRAGKKDK